MTESYDNSMISILSNWIPYSEVAAPLIIYGGSNFFTSSPTSTVFPFLKLKKVSLPYRGEWFYLIG